MRKILTLILLTALILTAACGRRVDDKVLRVMLGSNVVSLDTSQAVDSASFEVINDCMEGLLQLDAAGKVIPAVAESYEVSPDGKKYTFHLRDAKWSNGDAVTADDFVFAWRRHCAQANMYAFIMGKGVACIKNAEEVMQGADPSTLGVAAPNPKTFIVELTAPVPYFPSLMAFPSFFPINEKFYNSLEKDTYGMTPDTYLYNGAFVMTSYLPGSPNIQMKKNPSYWDAEHVTLEELHYQVVGSSDNALTAFRNNSLDLVNIDGNQVEYVRKDDKLSKDLKISPRGSLTYISFNEDPKNHHAGALTNANLRRAISNSVDRESLVKNYVMNGAQATYSVVPREFASNAETGKFFSEDQNAYKNLIGFNPDKAKEYLAAAKSELGKDNIDLLLTYSNDSGDMTVKIVQSIKSQVEKNLPGVTITLQPVTKAEYLSKTFNDDYDIAVVNWIADYNDPMGFLMLWTTENCEVAEHWSNAEYDRLIAECTTGTLAANYSARWQALHDAEKIMLQEAVIAPLYTGATSNLISSDVSGIEFQPVGVPQIFKHAVLNRSIDR